jgi:hypothetical protein
MELVLTDMLGGEFLGGAPEELGELRDIADVGLSGHGRTISQLHVFNNVSALQGKAHLATTRKLFLYFRLRRYRRWQIGAGGAGIPFKEEPHVNLK